jgi:hypothetical protein
MTTSTNTIRIKRRASGGGAGAPSSLANAELSFNEQTDILYYGTGTGGSGGSATSILPIGGNGAFIDLTTDQSIHGIKSFTSTIIGSVNGSSGSSLSAPLSGITELGNDIATSLAINVGTVGAPAIIGGVLGTPSSGTLTNTTGLPFSGLSGTPTTWNQNTTGNASTATALATGRSIAITGDLTYSSGNFDGTGNVTAAGTLATVNSNIGSFTKLRINSKGLVTAGVQAVLSELGAAIASVDVGSQNLINVLTPVNPNDGANKAYVDATAQGLSPKTSVLATTTANITLSGLQSIDSYMTLAGDRVLVKDQVIPANNGIYIAAIGAWTRAIDVSTWAEVVGAFVFTEGGAVFHNSGWVSSSAVIGTIGSTAITFVQFSQAGAYTASTGLTLTGGAFSITNTAVSAGSVGSASKTVSATVNAQGQLTSLSDQNIAIANTQVSGLGTMSTQSASAVSVSGGSIANTGITGTFTIDGTTATFQNFIIDGGTY